MKRGFTLIELMVVIGIIAVLTSITLAKLSASKTAARDAQRISDIGQIQFALEGYFQASPRLSPSYPQTLSDLQTGGFIKSLYLDPVTKQSYHYYICPEGSTTCVPNQQYCLGANLEQSNNPAIQNNTTCVGLTWCTLADNYKVCKQ